MCLIINSAVHKKRFRKYIPIKTKKDSIVYKGVKVDWNKEDIKSVWSPVQSFIYDINNEYCTKLGIVHKEVNEGFHSYLNKSFTARSSFFSPNCNAVATCIIPKGSKIFLSDNFIEIVSNKIRIIGVERTCQKVDIMHQVQNLTLNYLYNQK